MGNLCESAKKAFRLWYFIDMNKLLLYLFVTLIVVSFVTLLFLFYLRTTSKAPVPPPTTPTPTRPLLNLPTEKTIKSSGVEINNPFLSPKKVTAQGDVLFENTPTYHIAYLAQFDEFLITILLEPFEENRQQAESQFLTKLGITKKEACSLKVTISPPKKENELTPKYKLSFCEK